MIYSPSQTKSYLTCPTNRMLSQEGWTERMVGIRDWTAWIGQGVHAGLAYQYDPRMQGPPLLPGVVTAGKAEFKRQYGHAEASGRIIPPQFYVPEALANVERCLEYSMSNDLLPPGFAVDAVEQSLGDYNCILDVVGKRNGKPTFIDWKIKNKLRLDYLDKEMEKYRYDWKEARHYPWALSQVCGQQVEEYTVVIFILSPNFKVISRTYQVNWPMVERWAGGCSSMDTKDDYQAGVWELMEGRTSVAGCICSIEIPVHQSNACFDGPFPCEYLDACWTYNLDREKMQQGGFVKVERLKKEGK